MAVNNDMTQFFTDDIDLKELLDVMKPQYNLLLADDMMLSDAEGKILWVSESYERNFGFSRSSMVGRSVFDLEADGTFDPCITAQIIRQRRKVVATQTINHQHTNVMTVGVPIFDKRGELKFAVCFNTASMEQINAIHRNYRQMQDSLLQYSQQLDAQRTEDTPTNLVMNSPAMRRLWQLMQHTASTRANILITGETGVGKSVIAKAIHTMSNRSAKP